MRGLGRFRGMMSAALLLACLGPDEPPRPPTEPAPPPPPDPQWPEVHAAAAAGAGAEFTVCRAEGVDVATTVARVNAAGQAALDQRWPGVFELETAADEQGLLASMVSRRDRPRYPFIPGPVQVEPG